MKFEQPGSTPPILQERVVKLPEKKTAKDTSKEQLPKERKRLAQEIKLARETFFKSTTERVGNRDRIHLLRAHLEIAKRSFDSATVKWDES